MASGLQSLANLLGKVNASNALVVTLDGGTASATTFLAGDGTASAPSYSFTSDAAFGLWMPAASRLMLSDGTTATRFDVTNTLASLISHEAFSVDWQTTANQAIVGTRTAATGTGRVLMVGAQGDSGTAAWLALRSNPQSATPLSIGYYNASGTALNQSTFTTFLSLGQFTNTATSGTFNTVAVTPTYNQASGTAANTDLLINRTQTAVGSGAQNLLDAQVATVTKFSVSNLGLVRSASRVLQTRTDSSEATDGNATYTTTQVLSGWITRTNMGSNRVDAFPTAANLVAAIPGAAVGHSFTVVINNNDTAQTVTVNGASTGITYEGTATAIAAAEARLFYCVLTNVTGAAEAATVIQIV